MGIDGIEFHPRYQQNLAHSKKFGFFRKKIRLKKWYFTVKTVKL